ncbi:MAG: WD40 repeat domain-containing protein [Chloroflexota bacterium]
MQIRCIYFGLSSLHLLSSTRSARTCRVGLSLLAICLFLIACEANSAAQKQILAGHTSGVYALAWSLDGARFASGSGDGTVKVWDGVTKQAVYSLDVRGGGGNALS